MIDGTDVLLQEGVEEGVYKEMGSIAVNRVNMSRIIDKSMDSKQKLYMCITKAIPKRRYQNMEYKMITQPLLPASQDIYHNRNNDK